ncbi:MAG: SDR family oxidoreductase [Vampirovibrio sp.]|nr:SDR family oxidoreductase [Vampirovibrio sp.]
MNFGLSEKKALVCAASKGLGRAVATSLAAEGVELFLCARGEEALEKTAVKIRETASQPIHSSSCDLITADGRQKLIQAVQEKLGGIDILIHNIGGPKASTVENTSLEDWQAGFERNFISVMDLNNAFLPHMKAQQWGRIVAITSTSVVQPIPNLAVSNAMRAGLTATFKTLADEVAPSGVTVNTVAPGKILTDRTEERLQSEIKRLGKTREELLKNWAEEIPMKRLGDPSEYGPTVAFLCSQQASYITGATWCVDGGKRRAPF